MTYLPYRRERRTDRLTANARSAAFSLSSDQFGSVIWVGSGSLYALGGYSFSAGLVMAKGRTGSVGMVGIDSLRSSSNYRLFAGGASPGSNAGVFAAFDGTSFTVNNVNLTNALNVNYAAFAWKALPGFFQPILANASGTAGQQVSHNLGVKPMLILGRNNSASGWSVYHSSLGATKWYPFDGSGAATTSNVAWNDTEPDASVITIGSALAAPAGTGNLTLYAFAPMSGASAVGSYVSTTGNAVNQIMDFAPSLIMFRRDSLGGAFAIYSRAIGGDKYFAPGATNEATEASPLIFNSNGFSLPVNSSQNNVSNATYYWAAWA